MDPIFYRLIKMCSVHHLVITWHFCSDMRQDFSLENFAIHFFLWHYKVHYVCLTAAVPLLDIVYG